MANSKAVIAIIEQWLQAQSSDESALQQLDANRVPNAPVLSVEQAVKHPQLRARRTVRKIHDRILGEFEVPGFPLRFSEFPGELTLRRPFSVSIITRSSSNLRLPAPRIKRTRAAGVFHSGER